MSISLILLLVVTLVRLAIFAFVIYAAVQGVKALRKYNRSGEVRKEKAETRRSLGEALKEHRVRCKMTQEFVAESLGVSRQAVSKWETGTADPSSSADTPNSFASASRLEVLGSAVPVSHLLTA